MQQVGLTRPPNLSAHSFVAPASARGRLTPRAETPYVEMTSNAEPARPAPDRVPHSLPHTHTAAQRAEEDESNESTRRALLAAERNVDAAAVSTTTTVTTTVVTDHTEADVLLAEDSNADRSCCAWWRSLVALKRVLGPSRWLRYLWVLALMLMLFTGSTMQVVMLNFWLASYPAHGSPGNYTTFAVSAILFAVFFLVALAVYIALCRPSLAFLRKAQGWRWLLFVGLMDTLNSGLAIYAASYTSEVLQALFIAMVPVYAACLTKWVLKDPRRYADRRVLTSFALIIAGVLLAASWVLFGLSHNHKDNDNDKDSSSSSTSSSLGMSSDTDSSSHITTTTVYSASSSQGTCSSAHTSATRPRRAEAMSAEAAVSHRRWWALVFFLSVPPMVLMNVGQTLYMLRFTYDESFVDYVHSARRRTVQVTGEEAARDAGSAVGQQQQEEDNDDDDEDDDETAQLQAVHRLIEREGADDTTVKLVMLAADTTLQALMSLVLLPVDALPWFGRSASVAAAWDNFRGGMDCLVNCPHNLMYCLLYSLGFVLVYIGSAYLNQYSVTLCSMVSLLASPATALLLVAVPSLNVTEEAAPWPVNAMACVLLAAGTTLYVRWESRTEHIKSEGERRLKLALFGLAPAPAARGVGDEGHQAARLVVAATTTTTTTSFVNEAAEGALVREEHIPYMPVQSELPASD